MAQEWVFADEQPSTGVGEWVFADEAEVPAKRKTSIYEDIGIGLTSAKDTLLNAAALAGGGIAGLVGNTEARDEAFQAVLDRQKAAEEEAQQVEQGTGGKIVSGLTQIAPMLGAGAVTAGIKGAMYLPVVADTLTSAARDVTQGATAGQAVTQSVTSGAANALANAVLPGLGVAKGAAVGAGTNVAAQAATDISGQAIMGGTEAAKNYDFDKEKYIVSGAVGALPGAVIGGLTSKAKSAPKNQPNIPESGSVYVQREIGDLQKRYNNSIDKTKELRTIGENVVNSMAKIEEKMNKIKALPDYPGKDKILKSFEERLAKKQNTINSLVENINKIHDDRKLIGEKLTRLGVEPPKKPETPAVDEAVPPDADTVRAAAEEEQAGRIESQLEPEPTFVFEDEAPAPVDNTARIEGLNTEIESLQRFLGTKQGNNAARADAQAQLDSMIAERNSLSGETPDPTRQFAPVGEQVVRVNDDAGNPRPINDLLTEARDKAASPWTKGIIDRLLSNPNLDKLGIHVDELRLMRERARAAYSNATGQVIAQTDITPIDLAHEVTHGAVNDVLIKYEAGLQLPFEDTRAARTLKDAWNKVKDNPAMKDWKHGVSNMREFVAHLTDPTYANALRRAINDKWYYKVYDTFMDLGAKYLGMTRKEIGDFKKIIRSQEHLVDTAKGLATSRDILEAVGLYGRVDRTRKASPNSINDIASLSEPEDPLVVIENKLAADKQGPTPISDVEVQAQQFLAGRKELATSLKDSPIVRHTNAVLNRADELYESSKRQIIDGTHNVKRKAFGILRNLTDTAGEKSYTTIYEKTNKGDLTDAAEVVKKASREQVDVRTLPEFAALSKEKQELVSALRDTYKRGHEEMNKQLTAAGAKPMPFREGYIHHGRSGDYALAVHAKAANGEPVLAMFERFYTKAERDAVMEKIKKDHPDLYIDPDQDVFSMKQRKEHENAVKETETMQMLADANALGGKIDEELLNKLRMASLEGRFYGGHHLFQTAAEGYSGAQWFKTKQENARELFNAPFHYADEISRFSRNAFIRRNMDPIIDNPELMDKHRYLMSDPEILAAKNLVDRVIDPNYESTTKDVIDSSVAGIVKATNKLRGAETSRTGYPSKSVFDRTNGVVATVFNIKTMMARAAFSGAQAMSWLSQTPQYMSLQYGDSIGKQYKLMAQGIARAMDMRKGTEWDQFIERAKKTTSTYKPLMTNDFTQVRKEFDNAKLNRVMDKTTKVLTGIRLSEMADTVSRYMTSAILWEKANDLGLTGDARFRFVIDGTAGAAGLFQKNTKAPLITQTGVFGDLLAPVSNYAIMQGNWLATAVKRLAKNGELQPLMTVILSNIMAGGTAAAPLILEYELLRVGINSMLDEDDQLPSAVRSIHRMIGDGTDWMRQNVGERAANTFDVTMRQGAVTGALSAATGEKSVPDIGAGLRYQTLGKNVMDENKSLVDSFSAWSSIAKDVAQVKDVLTGKDNTEAGMRKAITGLRTTLVHDFMTQRYLLPWMKANGKSMQTAGKDSAAIMERTTADDIAQALGGRSTGLANEQIARQYRLEDERNKQQATTKALQGALDILIRQESGQLPPLMRDRMPMAVKRLEALSRKYPDMEPFLDTLSQRFNEEATKKALPAIIRDLQKAKPHEFKQKVDEWSKITGNTVTYK